MATNYPIIFDLTEISSSMNEFVGPKNGMLGDLISLNIKIPSGFVLTTYAYKMFLKKNELKNKIKKSLSTISFADNNFEQKSREIRESIERGVLPKEVKDEILVSYKRLSDSSNSKLAAVAVRSSSTVEDSIHQSMAGQHETYLNIRGERNLLHYIKKCYSSLFSERAIKYRLRNQNLNNPSKLLMSVGIQQMINSKSSGVLFTVNPVTKKKEILIEGAWGLGTSVVSGSINPDRFVLDYKTLRLEKKTIFPKNFRDVPKKSGGIRRSMVPKDLVRKQCLTIEQIRKLARIGLLIEKYYNRPVDIEWAIENKSNELYILQARPETTLPKLKV